MLLLAFDTSTPAITVAVHDGTSVIAEALATSAMAHGELLAPLIAEAMSKAAAAMADLTDVAVGVGPGPFTGLRVGVVTALTLGSTLNLSTHGVCSLDIIAADVVAESNRDEFIVATDARRKEVYWARYRGGQRTDGPQVSTPADLGHLAGGIAVFGPAIDLHSNDFAGGAATRVRAGALADLVASERAVKLPLEPLYLRRPDAVPRLTQAGV